MGQVLAKTYGTSIAICSIAFGNLILWLIAIAIVSMTGRIHSNAIDNIKSYCGKFGGMFAALLFLAAFLNWFAVQISSSVSELNKLFQIETQGHKDILIRAGAALGLLSALLGIGGIHLFKRITAFSLPLLFAYHLYAVINSTSILVKWTWGLSFSAVLTTVLYILPGVINFPTFFRHSISKAHSYLAITLMMLFITAFQISSIWMNFSFPSFISLNLISFAIFVILILTCCNFLNIYLASACWEIIDPRFGGAKGLAIIGLFGTLTYTFVQISAPVQFFQDLTNSYIATLGAVLLMAYLTRIIVTHRVRYHEKIINTITWLFGCLVATIYEIEHVLAGVETLLVGVNASLLFFIVVIFVEETVWAARKKWIKRATSK